MSTATQVCPQYTPTDIAKMTGLDASTIRKCIRSGALKAFKFGGQFRITDDDYAAWLESSRYVPDSTDGMKPPVKLHAAPKGFAAQYAWSTKPKKKAA